MADPRRLIRKLAHKFEVSEQAMEYRLVNLGVSTSFYSDSAASRSTIATRVNRTWSSPCGSDTKRVEGEGLARPQARVGEHGDKAAQSRRSWGNAGDSVLGAKRHPRTWRYIGLEARDDRGSAVEAHGGDSRGFGLADEIANSGPLFDGARHGQLAQPSRAAAARTQEAAWEDHVATLAADAEGHAVAQRRRSSMTALAQEQYR